MALRRLDHVSILAKDPAPVLDFYGQVLGFKLERKRDLPEMGMTIYELKARGDFVELIVPTDPSSQVEGVQHVAFLSDDIEADFDAFRKAGARLLHKSIQRHGDVSLFFAQAPAGHYVEVIQYA